MVGVDLADVDLEAGAVLLIGRGHNEKERFTLPEPTAATLKAWLVVRGAEPGALFLSFDRAGKGPTANVAHGVRQRTRGPAIATRGHCV